MGKKVPKSDNGLIFDLSFFANTEQVEKTLTNTLDMIDRVGDKFAWLGEKATESLEKSVEPLKRAVEASMSIGRVKKDGSPNMTTEENEAYGSNVIKIVAGQAEQINNIVLKMQHTVDLMVQKLSLSKQLVTEVKRQYSETADYASNIEQNELLSIKRRETKLKVLQANKDKLAELKRQERELNQYIAKNAKTEEDVTKEKAKQVEEQEKLNKKSVKQISIITKIRKMFASVYILKRFSSLFTDMVDFSGKWIENLNLFAVSFGRDFYKTSLDWASEFSEKLGVSINDIVKLTANFRQLTSAIGYTQEVGDNLSRTLTSLAYDLTSYYNLEDVNTAYTKLSSGIFSGQVKTLRSLGVDVSAESITTYLKELSGTYSEFLGISNSGLNQSQKVLARTLLVMKSATNSFGDMSRSIETLANRQRVLESATQNLKLALGDLFADTLSTGVAYLNGIIRAITTIIRVFKPLKTELSYDIGGTALGQLNEDAEEVQKNLNKLSFDKFETLTGGDKSKGQLGITEALTAELEKQIALYEQQASQWSGIDETANKVYKTIVSFVFPDAFDEATGKLKEDLGDINPLLVVIGASLAFIVGLKIATKIGSLISMLPKLKTDLNDISGILSLFIDKSVDIKDFMSLAETSNMSKWVQGLTTSLGGLRTMLTALASHPIILAIIAVVAVLTALYFTNEDFRNSVNSLLSVLGNLFSSLWEILYGVLKPILQVLGGAFAELVAIVTFISNILVTAINVAMVALIPFVGIFEFLMKILQSVLQLLADIATFNFLNIGKNLSSIWTNWKTPQFAFNAMTSVMGYADGGSLDLGTQIWGMNEKGNPEFMFNAGGYDSVINADILEKAIAKGTASAIISSGLLESSNQELVIKGDRIDNDALARAIFPALQKESKRLGGNKL